MNILQVIFFSSVLICSVIGCSVGPAYETVSDSSVSATSINSSYEGSTSKSQGVYLFDYDSSALNTTSSNEIKVLAQELNSNSSLRLRIEGHCDERGTREYNLALGERRAQTVKDLLIINGVASKRIITVSYGEEKPINTDSNNNAWAMNRRVEVKAF
jgi:peptidoglycan-associated lipoprotein